MVSIRTETREQAFSLYCLNVPQEKIATRLGFNTSTISRWIKKYDWAKKKDEIMQFSKDNAKYSQIEQEDKVIDFMLAKGFQYLKEDKVRYSARDVAETIKLRSIRRGEATEKIEHSGSVDSSGRFELVVNYPKDYVKPKKEEIK